MPSTFLPRSRLLLVTLGACAPLASPAQNYPLCQDANWSAARAVTPYPLHIGGN